MPVTTPQGTLDFKKVDRVTFVGASSNTVIDTTTGSLGVGVGVGGPTSNLHVVGNALITGNVSDLNVVSNVNMLHTSNTASIKLNSNVVTEFPRSKKFIKYPRVAMTANSSGGYVASASSVYNVSHANQEWEAFDNVIDPDGSGADSWDSLSNGFSSSGYPRTPTGTATTFDGEAGEWLNIRLPEKIILYEYEHITRANRTHEGPYSGFLYGSNDSFTTYDKIHTFSAINLSTRASYVHTVNTVKSYNEYRLHVTRVQGSPYLNISNFYLYGVPEYDPEAHGVDVTIKSVPNVPNTDWLDVYYDGQDYTSMPVTVTDKSGNNRTGTPTGGVGFDTEYKAFTFDGSNDYISTTSTATLTYHTASMWIQFDSPGNGWECVYSIAPSTPSGFDNFNLYFNTNYFRLESGVGSNFPYYDFDYDFEIGKWVHLTFIFRGSGLEDCEMYINNKRLSHSSGSQNSTADITLSGTNILRVGAAYSTSYVFDGSIANFRLFNRALTSDEIYQLYAYQKEYFGHGDLSMTLKAGRLGIGTSEPRAALDVQGIPHGPNSRPCWTLRTTSVNSDNFAVWDQLDVDNFNGATGDTDYIIPISGYYFMQAIVIVSASGGRATLRFYKNGTGIGANFLQDPVTTSINQNRPWNQLTGIITYYFKQGDVVKVYVDGSTYSAYNCFTGFHLGF